mgnify:CR=1 FL=1|jgi:hypothetical protein
MTLSLVIIIPVVSVILICVYVYFFKGNTKNVLQRYGTMPTHPKFQRVVVTVDGCDGDLDKTINSVLSQDIRVSEIASDKKTCNVSNMCESVLNRYSDPYNKGVIKSTFERELDADTVVVFIKRGYAFPSTNTLRNLLDQWAKETPVKTPDVSVMNAAQCN